LGALAMAADCRYHPAMIPDRQALQDLFDQAVALHQRGDLPQAERLYQQALLLEPKSFAPRHMLGVIRFQQGRHDEAMALIEGALALNAQVAGAWINLGHVQTAAGRPADAAASYARALALQPGDANVLGARVTALWNAGYHDEALAGMDQLVALLPGDIEVRHHRANMRRERKRLEEALADYEFVLKARPDLAETWSNRGAVLSELGRNSEALESLDWALKLQPDMAAALSNRGFALRELARFGDALADLDRAIALAPDHAPGHANRGKVLSEMMRLEESFASFLRAGELAYGSQPLLGGPAHKQRHDDEQQAWLAGQDEGGRGPLLILGGARIADRAVNPANAAAAQAWRESDPKIVVVDNLLSEEALAGLRRYCLGSGLWRTPYAQGYLGAFPESGFAAPILAQVAEELAETFGEIFAGHPLRYHWAFKYDSSLDGIGIHADEAAVNVNFWITPDAANLDPDHGGLVIWDKAAPLEWDFAKYNADEGAAYDFLAQSGAKPITVPYRANRAVIFDSNLFHKTDIIRFAPGYENRRINIALLYGRRG
jgi:tetratricopeptide (TPR) repeat protein